MKAAPTMTAPAPAVPAGATSRGRSDAHTGGDRVVTAPAITRPGADDRYLQIRRDLLTTNRLDTVTPAGDGGRSGRRRLRTGRRLAAVVVGVMAHLEADWRTSTMRSWPMVAWGAELGMPYWRLRGAVDRLAGAGLATVVTAKFRPSSITLPKTPWLHERGDDYKFVQLSGTATRDLVDEHHLSWRQLGVLLALVLLADDRDWQVSGHTLASLGELLEVGYRSLTSALEALAAAGLVTWQARRGHLCAITVPAGAAIVVPSEPAARKKRRELRDLARQTARGEGPAAALGRKLVTRWQLEAPPSKTLIEALGDLLARCDAGVAERKIVAMGNLNSRDPMGVLVYRARRLVDEIHAADDAAEDDRAKRSKRAEDWDSQRSAKQAGEDVAAGESRWLAQVLDDDATLRRLQELYRATLTGASRRATVAAFAAGIAQGARVAVAEHPELAPAAAVRGHTHEHLAFDSDRELLAVLPQARAGPSLTARLSQLLS